MLFQNAFAFGDVGYASALAWVMFAILLVVTVMQLRFSRRNSLEQ
jgi:multiple sugar transport system permease protein